MYNRKRFSSKKKRGVKNGRSQKILASRGGIRL